MIESSGTTGFGLRAHGLEERRETLESPFPCGGGKTFENALGEFVLHGLEAQPSAPALVRELHLGGPAILLVRGSADESRLLEPRKVPGERAGGDTEELPESAETQSAFSTEGLESRRLGYGHAAALDVGPFGNGKTPQQRGKRAP